MVAGSCAGVTVLGDTWATRASATAPGGSRFPAPAGASGLGPPARPDKLGYSPSSDTSSQDAGAERRRVMPGPPREPPSAGLLGGGVQRGPSGTRERRGHSAPPRLGAGSGVPGSPAAAATTSRRSHSPPAPASSSPAGGSAPPAHSPSGLQGNRDSSATPGGHPQNATNPRLARPGHLLWSP